MNEKHPFFFILLILRIAKQIPTLSFLLTIYPLNLYIVALRFRFRKRSIFVNYVNIQNGMRWFVFLSHGDTSFFLSTICWFSFYLDWKLIERTVFAFEIALNSIHWSSSDVPALTVEA